MSQTTIIIGVALNGSIHTSVRSGFRIMSDSLIVFQPAIDDPSNIRPSSSMSSSITPEAIVRCCHLPLGSVKRRSIHSISSSLIRFTISDALAISRLPSWSARQGAGFRSLLPSRSREGPGVGERDGGQARHPRPPPCPSLRCGREKGENRLDRVFVLLAGADAKRGIDRR